MPLKINGVPITDLGNIENLDINGINVFNSDSGPKVPPYFGLPSPLIITASGDYVAGIDFPAAVLLSVCGCGGGGGGAKKWSEFTGGGSAGEVRTDSLSIDIETIITVIIGGGGAGGVNDGGAGTSGGVSSFGESSFAGGGSGGGRGAGESVTTCLGTANNGTLVGTPDQWGGMSSGYANGGNGGGSAGGIGSGGGGYTDNGNNVAGAGGAGIIIVSW